MALSDVTVVVFTRDRRKFVQRLASFWSQYDVRLIIFDNGSEEWSLREKASLGFNQAYHFSPGDFVTQMKSAADHLSTPYVLRLDDDNMFSPYALRTALESLASDASIVGVTAQAAIFRVSRGDCVFAPTYEDNLGFQNVSMDPLMRVRRALNPYRVFGWYAVQKLETFKVLAQLAADAQAHSSCPYALEIAEEIGYAWLGPSRSIDALGLFRSQENPPIDHQSLRRFRFHEWYVSREHTNEVDHFHQSLIESLKLTQSQFREIREVLGLYVERSLSVAAHPGPWVSLRRLGARTLASGFGVTISPESRLRRCLDWKDERQWQGSEEFYADNHDLGPRQEFMRISEAIAAVHVAAH